MRVFDFIKNSYDYCSFNKKFLLLILSLMIFSQFLSKIFITRGNILTALSLRIFFLIIFWGYGLQITEDIVTGGERLPKIIPKKVLIYGVKGLITYSFYIFIQAFLLSFICAILRFPILEAKELILDLNKTVSLFYNHDPKFFILFFILDFIVTYVVVFFMEIGLARIIDNKNLRDAFNFKQIWKTINIIGFKEYSIEYTYLIFSILILTYIKNFLVLLPYIDFFADLFLELMLFVIQFMAIGLIYREFKLIMLQEVFSYK